MNKRLGAIATLVTAVAAAAGLFARPSIGAANNSTDGYCKVPWCIVALTGTGPSPSDVKMDAANYLEFSNPDSVAHTVVFANGLCSLTVSLGTGGAPHQWADCKDNFSFYAGSYAYTVDGKFPGRWKLTVRPGETTTYIAKVTGQLPQGRIWTSAKSRPFTVRIRH
jgi:hypothetical protein